MDRGSQRRLRGNNQETTRPAKRWSTRVFQDLDFRANQATLWSFMTSQRRFVKLEDWNKLEYSQQTCLEQAGRQSTDGPGTRWKTVNRRAGNKLEDSQQTGQEHDGRQSTDGPGTSCKTVNRRAGNKLQDSQQTGREHD